MRETWLVSLSVFTGIYSFIYQPFHNVQTISELQSAAITRGVKSRPLVCNFPDQVGVLAML